MDDDIFDFANFLDMHLVQLNHIYAFVLSHLALIFLAIDNGITFTDAPESTKKLCTLKLKILKVNNKGGQSVFTSIINALSTYSRELEELPDPLSEEATLPIDVYPSAHKRVSC